MEKYLENIKHIEAQVARDVYGNAMVVDIRNCTMQRDHQKFIEETAILPQQVVNRLTNDALNLMISSGYVGFGTIEFLYDPQTEETYFMEVNPRLQVERRLSQDRFPDFSFPEWQVRIAQNEKLDLTQMEKKKDTHLMQLRINAINPKSKFAPSAGVISSIKFPEIEGVKVYSSVREGDRITPYYDTNFMLVVAEGVGGEQLKTIADCELRIGKPPLGVARQGIDGQKQLLLAREDAINKLLKFLEEFEVEGIYTNKDFLKACLSHEDFKSNEYYTNFVEKNAEKIIPNLPEPKEILAEAGEIKLQDNQFVLNAPMGGTFYRTRKPGDDPLAQVGETITKGHPLAIVEAMKMFSDIEYTGEEPVKVVDILCEAQDIVEQGQPLFILEKIKE
jgi:acetyl-CoA carboxylase biotin carboxylase subunit